MTQRWVIWTTFGLALAALAISLYLTIAHFTDPGVLVCSGSGTIDCARVTTSAQSLFLGIPVAVLGLVWSIAMVMLCSAPAWRADSPWVRRVRVVTVSAGILFVLWLVYAELLVIHAICLWCSAMHMVTFALFVIIVVFASIAAPGGPAALED
jgi:uncharacterized membrane protein